VFIVLGCVSVIGPAAMDSYLPGLPALARDFGSSTSSAQVTLTTFLVGLAVGQFVAGSLSDVHGRRRPLIGGLVVFALASLICAVAPNLYLLAAMRFVQGASGAAGMAIGRAVVRDLYSGASAARYLSRLMLIIGLGPILAPVVGGQLLRFTSWRGIFIALALLGLVLAVVASWQLPETLAQDRRRDPGVSETRRSVAFLLRGRRFDGYVLVVGLSSGAVVAYVAGSSFVLEDRYGASPQLFGVLFAANALFMVAGAQLNAHLLRTRSPRLLLGFGLAAMIVAGASLLVAVSFPRAGLAVVVPPLALLMFSWSFIQANALALALTDHPSMAGTASAVLGVSQYGVGAIIAPLVGIGGNQTALPMALVIGICALGAAVAFRSLVLGAPRPQTALAPSDR
jgi:DHA1 family bicyclomycin/chloramphenicol resistance-like MFS transporter